MWTQPTEQLRSIVDYLIQRQCSKLKTNDVRAYQKMECKSNNHLVKAKIIIEHKKKPTKINRNMQNSLVCLELAKYNLAQRRQDSIQCLYYDLNSKSLYKQTIKCIHKTAAKDVGQRDKIKQQKTKNGLIV